MPHECTTCGRTFADGSKGMLSGCPDCGGNKFQYHPEAPTERSSDDGEPVESSTDSSFEFGSSSSAGESPVTDGVRSGEDRAQASARSTVVSEEELALSNSEDPTVQSDDDSDAKEPTAESGDAGTPDSELSDLREELNEQFESIKIHDRGEYELNLMELYDREEHIIALQEDGRYVIDVPSSWRENDESG